MNKLVLPCERNLAECESVIERGKQTFVEVGLALMEIRDRRLYRETHATFEDYCRERWGWERTYAYRQIQAAQYVTEMLPTGNKVPENEYQARELIRASKAPEPKPNLAVHFSTPVESGPVEPLSYAVPEPSEVTPERVVGPPCVGMQFARIAIMKLSEIRRDDLEREQAFQAVERWISEHT